MIQRELNLREERDFGQKFNAVFSFIQQNAKSFLKTLLLLVGPLVLLGGIFLGMVYSKMFGAVGNVELLESDMPFSGSSIWEMLLSNLFLSLASVWLGIVVYAYMAEYLAGNRNITIEAVWERGKGKILPVIGIGFIIFFTIMVVTLAFVFIPLGPIWLRMIILVCLAMYFAIVVSLAIPIMIIEDEPIFESIGRSFTLIKGQWWATFGLMIVMGMISGMATMIFAIPFYVIMFMSFFLQTGGLGEILMIVASCILFAGAYLMATLPLLALAFQYFNLSEKKEGTGLLEKVNQIGEKPDTANEGEY